MSSTDSDSSPVLNVDFTNHTKADISQPALTRHLNLILRRISAVGTVEIEIILVGDKAIQQLNHKFLGLDRPTDVLSFPSDGASNSNLTGSIAISMDTAAIQAQQAGITLEDEVKMLVGHGLLHLLGYHHA